jgi:hypothetical protein
MVFKMFQKCDNYLMAVKPVPLELGGFRPGLNLYERDEIQCPKHDLNKRTHLVKEVKRHY